MAIADNSAVLYTVIFFWGTAASSVGEFQTNSQRTPSSGNFADHGRNLITTRLPKSKPFRWGDPLYSRHPARALCQMHHSRVLSNHLLLLRFVRTASWRYHREVLVGWDEKTEDEPRSLEYVCILKNFSFTFCAEILFWRKCRLSNCKHGEAAALQGLTIC